MKKKKLTGLIMGLMLSTILLILPTLAQHIVYCDNWPWCEDLDRYCGAEEYEEDDCVITCKTGETETEIVCRDEEI